MAAAPGSVVEKRVENEGFLAAPGGGRQRIRAVTRIEHTGLALGLPIAALHYLGGLRRGRRRQIEGTFAPTAAKRENDRAEQDHGPSRRRRAKVAIHDKIPNAAAPYKD